MLRASLALAQAGLSVLSEPASAGGSPAAGAAFLARRRRGFLAAGLADPLAAAWLSPEGCSPAAADAPAHKGAAVPAGFGADFVAAFRLGGLGRLGFLAGAGLAG